MKLRMILTIVAVLTVGAVFIACAKRPAKTPKGDAKLLPNSPVALNDTLDSFRFERYDTGSGESEVYFITFNRKSDFTYLYGRKLGDRKAISYDNVTSVLGDTHERLVAAAAELGLGNYPTMALREEDTKRSRWCVKISFAHNSKSVNIVEYYDGQLAGDGLVVRDRLTGIFSQLLETIDAGGFPKPSGYSVYSYDNKGKLIKRIDYTADDIVHGGMDVNKPGARF